MRTFKNDPKRFSELRKLFFVRTIPMMALALAVGLYIGLSGPQAKDPKVNVMPLAAPIAIAVAVGGGVLGLFRASKRQQELYETYRLTLDETAIVREQKTTPTIRIPINEITRITKNANSSFTIRGRNDREMIGVAPQIEDHAELERLLGRIRPFGGDVHRPLLEKYSRFSGVLTVILFALVFLSNEKTVVLLSGSLLTGLLCWSFVEIRKSKHIDARTKRSMYMVVFPLFAVLAKIAFLWL